MMKLRWSALRLGARCHTQPQLPTALEPGLALAMQLTLEDSESAESTVYR
jgi:hypothetical protein